jgi:hypothetical protein
MPFLETRWFPFVVGFGVLALAIGFGAAGWIAPRWSAAVAMFAMGFVLDFSSGTHGLAYLSIKHPRQRRLAAQRLFYARQTALPRYGLALFLGTVFFLLTLLSNSETAIVIGVIACTGIYSVVSFRSLLQAFREAGGRPDARGA